MASTTAPPAKPVPAGANDSDDDEDDIESQQYKICVLGDGSVGKTSIVMRFTQDFFAATYKQTLGIDFFLGTVVFPRGTTTSVATAPTSTAAVPPPKAAVTEKVSSVPVHVALQCLDIGGQAIGSKMMGSYIHGADAVLLVYDITNALSFENLRDWLDVVKQTYEEKKEEMPYLALVANKSDLEYMRAVKSDKHNQFAKDENLHSFMVSAKSADGIKTTFHRIAAGLAKVQLTKAELESASVAPVVKAQVINHPQHDPSQAPLVLKTGTSNNKCVVM